MENKEIIAVVGGEEITNEMFQDFMDSIPQEQKAYASNPQFVERLKEQFISLFTYAKYGEELKLDETEQFKIAMENAKRDKTDRTDKAEVTLREDVIFGRNPVNRC